MEQKNGGGGGRERKEVKGHPLLFFVGAAAARRWHAENCSVCVIQPLVSPLPLPLLSSPFTGLATLFLSAFTEHKIALKSHEGLQTFDIRGKNYERKPFV
jgi:hypothetical protein